MNQAQLIDGLNHALNREISTFLRYMLQASMIKGAPWDSVRAMYAAEVQDEVGHAQLLAQEIVNLGGVPKLAPDLKPPPADVRAMLENDIKEEHVDVEHYKKLAEGADKLGLIALKLQMEEQAADEQRHALAMRRMLG